MSIWRKILDLIYIKSKTFINLKYTYFRLINVCRRLCLNDTFWPYSVFEFDSTARELVLVFLVYHLLKNYKLDKNLITSKNNLQKMS